MVRARLLPLLAVLLLGVAVPSTAAAQDPLWDDTPDPGWEDPAPDDGGWPETPVDETPAETPVDDTPVDDGFGLDDVLPEDLLDPLFPVPERPDPLRLPTTRARTVPGKLAKLRTDGKAAIPVGAPKRVREIIRAANQIVGKPYKWGGGHAKLVDRGYDCSGTVSYALIRAGLQRAPLVSGRFAKAFVAGKGRHVTIYANKGHVYLEVAGLRLDTSAVGDPYGSRKGPRWRPLVGKRSGFKVRHPVGL